MVSAGLWKARPRKLCEVHQGRPRRSAYGEPVQSDTSNHDWLEGRGESVRYLVRSMPIKARMNVVGNPYENVPAGSFFNPAAFALPALGIASPATPVWVTRAAAPEC
jgi:hypothetical protein